METQTKETQFLHFRVGADAGILLINIAQEHLLYGNDIDKALNVFNESFGGGCPMEMQLDLLKGDKVIEVDVDEQQFMVCDREDYHDKIFPARIDFEKWFAEKEIQLEKHGKSLEEGLDMIAEKFKYSGSYVINFSNEAVMKFIYGDDEDLINELREDYELNQMQLLIQVCKDFIEKSFKFAELARKINAFYGLEIEFDSFDIIVLAEKIQKIARLDFWTGIKTENLAIENYIESAKEIDVVLSKGIEPVDIMDNYSAGWLSPEGEYYALNGEIANMLHIQIASALQEKGVIPMYENDRDKEVGIEQNPDAWLEQHGWVKIHGNNVQFAGNLNNRLDMPIVHITDKQIEIIRDYITDCHQCEIKAGWRLERTSIGRFTALAMADKIGLYKKYFDF